MDLATTKIVAAINQMVATVKGTSPSWVRGAWSGGTLRITIVYTPTLPYAADSGHAGVGLTVIEPPTDDVLTISCTRHQAAAWMHSAAWHLGAWDIVDKGYWTFRPTWLSPTRSKITKDVSLDQAGMRPYVAKLPPIKKIEVLGREA